MKHIISSLLLGIALIASSCGKDDEPKAEPVDDLDKVVVGSWVMTSMTYTGDADIPGFGPSKVRGEGKDITGKMTFNTDPDVVSSDNTFKVTVIAILAGNSEFPIPDVEPDFVNLFDGGSYKVISNNLIELQQDTLNTSVKVTSYTNTTINLEFNAVFEVELDGATYPADLVIKGSFRKE
jgi:hypothetical protein